MALRLEDRATPISTCKIPKSLGCLGTHTVATAEHVNTIRRTGIQRIFLISEANVYIHPTPLWHLYEVTRR